MLPSVLGCVETINQRFEDISIVLNEGEAICTNGRDLSIVMMTEAPEDLGDAVEHALLDVYGLLEQLELRWSY